MFVCKDLTVVWGVTFCRRCTDKAFQCTLNMSVPREGYTWSLCDMEPTQNSKVWTIPTWNLQTASHRETLWTPHATEFFFLTYPHLISVVIIMRLWLCWPCMLAMSHVVYCLLDSRQLCPESLVGQLNSSKWKVYNQSYRPSPNISEECLLAFCFWGRISLCSQG